MLNLKPVALIAVFCGILAPSVAIAQMRVAIKVGKDAASSSVTATGYTSRVVSAEDQTNLKLTSGTIATGVERYKGKKANDTFLTSPTPWNDLYKTYGWKQVTLTMRPVRAEIVNFQSTPVVISRDEMSNTSARAATFHADVSDEVSTTISTTWTNTQEFMVGQSISYEVGVSNVVSVGGETSLQFTASSGTAKTEETSHTVGSAAGVSVELQPGEKMAAELLGTRGNLRVRVTYAASLSGYVAVNYNPKYDGHHFYALPITQVLSRVSVPYSFNMVEDINVGFYSNIAVELSNL